MELKKEELEITVNKMVRIVRGDTGASRVYRDMLLSLLPNSQHKVCISYWNYKADRDDFKTILKLMVASSSDVIWAYEELVLPFKDELLNFCASES